LFHLFIPGRGPGVISPSDFVKTVQASLWDAILFLCLDPALKRRAIFRLPFGDAVVCALAVAGIFFTPSGGLRRVGSLPPLRRMQGWGSLCFCGTSEIERLGHTFKRSYVK